MYAAQWAKLKGASRIIGIDAIPERLRFAKTKLQIETINFKEVQDIPKRIHELVPGGVDVALDCGRVISPCGLLNVIINGCLGTFHEPKTWTHKIQKTLMLETDVPETLNEMLVSVRKMGRCGLIAAYAGFANGVNVGALMEKGVR
jgi:threonine dehydrogenase-like Zn-dependent dehydrogenase